MTVYENLLSRPAGTPAADRGTAVDLVAFPCAGSGSAGYRGWREALPADWRFAVACPPGRETTYGQPFAEDMARLADDMAAELRARRADGTGAPLVLFGHSMGGLLAQLVALRVTADALVVAACPPPAARAALDDGRPLDHEELRREVAGMLRAVSPMDPALLAELVDLTAPVLAADVELLATYRAPSARLSCDVWALYGRDDTLERLPWTAETTAAAHVRVLPGSHFFVQESPAAVIAELRRCLAPVAGGAV
ncbi:alpha/beta fold hydrolase [Streptomyces sp. NPDC093260]|uniref:thioesterase II family protein n=1 Tax=Streptomyces sp. NPDC093260 TaxID=3155073 RepID=UPI003441B0AC